MNGHYRVSILEEKIVHVVDVFGGACSAMVSDKGTRFQFSDVALFWRSFPREKADMEKIPITADINDKRLVYRNALISGFQVMKGKITHEEPFYYPSDRRG